VPLSPTASPLDLRATPGRLHRSHHRTPPLIPKALESPLSLTQRPSKSSSADTPTSQVMDGANTEESPSKKRRISADYVPLPRDQVNDMEENTLRYLQSLLDMRLLNPQRLIELAALYTPPETDVFESFRVDELQPVDLQGPFEPGLNDSSSNQEGGDAGDQADWTRGDGEIPFDPEKEKDIEMGGDVVPESGDKVVGAGDGEMPGDMAGLEGEANSAPLEHY
jgi:hypothetical protein